MAKSACAIRRGSMKLIAMLLVVIFALMSKGQALLRDESVLLSSRSQKAVRDRSGRVSYVIETAVKQGRDCCFVPKSSLQFQAPAGRLQQRKHSNKSSEQSKQGRQKTLCSPACGRLYLTLAGQHL